MKISGARACAHNLLVRHGRGSGTLYKGKRPWHFLYYAHLTVAFCIKTLQLYIRTFGAAEFIQYLEVEIVNLIVQWAEESPMDTHIRI